ncbi:hypothetical protein, partial [Flavobacterium sp.]|uniref:hypothetical protein n=1 Tax=Flavobacterium sp. TaxID=239 RepID=UPI0033402392
DAEILNKPTIPDPSDFVEKADYSPAHSILAQQSGTGSPTAVTIGTNEILGRLSSGGSNIEGLSVSQVKALLDLENSNTGDETATTIKQKLEVFEAKQESALQSTTGTTPIAITELKVTPSINKRYSLTACIHLGCSGVGGVRIGITIPTGATIFITGFGTAGPATSNSIMSFINANNGFFDNAFVTANSQNGMCIVHGEIEMGATTGDVQFTFRSITSGQTSTVLKTGSFMKLEEI